MRISDWSSDVCSSDLSGETQRLDTMLAQQTELAGRLAAAEANLNAAESARAGMPGGRETLLLLATQQLRGALQGPGPYAGPLALLKKRADAEAALNSIGATQERRAPDGAPTDGTGDGWGKRAYRRVQPR